VGPHRHRNAFFGVLSRERYENPDAVDAEHFWKTGREDVESFMKLGFDNSKGYWGHLKNVEQVLGNGEACNRWQARASISCSRFGFCSTSPIQIGIGQFLAGLVGARTSWLGLFRTN
jgi:hypothetical protein